MLLSAMFQATLTYGFVEEGLMKSGHLITRISDSCVEASEEVGPLRTVLRPSASLVPQGSGKSFSGFGFGFMIQQRHF